MKRLLVILIAVLLAAQLMSCGKSAAQTVSTVSENGENSYYLTVGADGVKSIEIKAPDIIGGCQNADGSPYKKGDQIWLEPLDGRRDLKGVTISASGENGEFKWEITIPENDEEVFSQIQEGEWVITKLP